MAREHGGPDGAAVCPVHSGLRQYAAGESAVDSAPDRVHWAGLPVNLDLVFSQQQRDKVYAQHLMRKRGSGLWRWLQRGAQPCTCEVAVDRHTVHRAVDSMPSR